MDGNQHEMELLSELEDVGVSFSQALERLVTSVVDTEEVRVIIPLKEFMHQARRYQALMCQHTMLKYSQISCLQYDLAEAREGIKGCLN